MEMKFLYFFLFVLYFCYSNVLCSKPSEGSTDKGILTRLINNYDSIIAQSSRLGYMRSDTLFYNLAIYYDELDHDTLICIDGSHIENYLGINEPPPIPGTNVKYDSNETFMDVIGTTILCNKRITIYADKNISNDYIRKIIGEMDLIDTTNRVLEYECPVHYEPYPCTFRLFSNGEFRIVSNGKPYFHK